MPKPSKQLAALVAKALRVPTSSAYKLESTLALRYPWFSRAVRIELKGTKFTDDNELLLFCQYNLFIEWHKTRDYQIERQRLADRTGVDYNKIKDLPVIAAVLSSALEYWISLGTLSFPALMLERMKVLNENWRCTLEERRDLDPLGGWGRPNYSKWMKKRQWDRHEFASLISRLDPAGFDEDRIDRAVPYSLKGTKVKQLLEKIDEANITFPAAPRKLRSWAHENGIPVPVQMSPGRDKRLAASNSKPAARATIDAMRVIIDATATANKFTVTKDRLHELVENVVGDTSLSTNSFNLRIWKPLSACVKASGKPDTRWTDAWPTNEALLKAKLQEELKRLGGQTLKANPKRISFPHCNPRPK